MNEWLKRLLEQAKGLWGRWNTTQKIILFSVLGVGIVAIVLLFSAQRRPGDGADHQRAGHERRREDGHQRQAR